jgi:hypothetical protein
VAVDLEVHHIVTDGDLVLLHNQVPAAHFGDGNKVGVFDLGKRSDGFDGTR